MLNCEICERPHHESRLPFICAVDARNVCYENRLRHLQAVMDCETVEAQVEAQVKIETENKCAGKDVMLSSRKAAQDRTSQVLAQASKLRGDNATAREDIQRLKEELRIRKVALSSSSPTALASQRVKQLEETRGAMAAVREEWDQVAENAAATRAFLCMEAAKLYGLRRARKGPSRHEYKLGGVDVIDLASMNSLSPELISTSLAHVAHILMLTSHYLSVRLPAEIITPRRNHARPAIFNLASSYQPAARRFRAGEVGSTSTPRPRPLFVEKSLPTLAKEDAAAHSFFLEGATLLAYDVAWLCLSQNIAIGDRLSFDDVCNMGRNLYNLLIASQLQNNAAPAGRGDTDGAKTANLMGRYSHGTAHDFLGSAVGTEFVRSFKLPSPMKLVDKLKKRLGSDATMPEWEVVENGDWDEGP